MADLVQLACAACGAKNRVPRERLADVPVCGKCRAHLFSEPPANLDDRSFDRYLAASELPVVVDFWAEWCGPCHAMAPHFAAVAQRLAGEVLCVKLDTDGAKATAGRFAIQSIPTLILFLGGVEVARQSGAGSADQLEAWIRNALP